MKQTVIFDFDGTLSDATWREHHLHKEPKDWESFFSSLDKDPIIEPIAKLYKVLSTTDHYRVIIMTGRPERYREMSEKWLAEHGLPVRPIYCRPDNDERHDLVIKKEIYQTLLEEGHEISFVVEDRNTVVEMWRELGVVCLHCFDADF